MGDEGLRSLGVGLSPRYPAHHHIDPRHATALEVGAVVCRPLADYC
jgi:hypothetical protein